MPKVIVLDRKWSAKAIQKELREINGCQVYKVVTASSARAKAEMIFDLLIVDPSVNPSENEEFDGLAAARDIKERRGLRDDQIILISTTPREELPEATWEITNFYLQKSIHPGLLKCIVKAILSGLPK